jgi:maltooligosyltrehalose trehalohydrolase
MTPAERGWWRLEVDQAGPGWRYAFSRDGGPARPDPRSPAQPDGVDGWSEVVDHRAYGWGDRGWKGFHLPGSVLYELHVGTFSPEGTFDGVAARLGHLTDLGVDAIEIMPIASFAGSRGWGYDGVALYAPHRTYGGPDGFKRMVDACHQAGVAVILDVVYNHLGPSGNHLREFGPYFSGRHRTNWGEGVNLDGPGSDEVRRFFVDNALMWFADYHVDGLRLDAVHALADTSATHFLEQLSAEVTALAAHVGRPLTLIAESDLNDPRFVRPPTEGGYGVDAAWADEWHHAWHALATGERAGYYQDFGAMPQLAKALRQAWVYDGIWSEHRGRTFGRPPAGLTGDRFVVSTQNHDQVGNRAAGERSSQLMPPGRLKVAAGLLLTSPFVPILFQGEEWGATTPWQYFTDFADPDLGQAVTEGRRSEFASFGWDPEAVPDPQDEATFDRSRLDWSELDKEAHADLLRWYRHLRRLRRQLPDLTDPDLRSTFVSYDDVSSGVAVRRGRVVVAAALASGPARLSSSVLGSARLVAASSDRVTLCRTFLDLGADSLAVVVVAGGAQDDLDGDAGEVRPGRRTATPPPTNMEPDWSWARRS